MDIQVRVLHRQGNRTTRATMVASSVEDAETLAKTLRSADRQAIIGVSFVASRDAGSSVFVELDMIPTVINHLQNILEEIMKTTLPPKGKAYVYPAGTPFSKIKSETGLDLSGDNEE